MIQSAQHTIPYDGMNVWYRVIATYVSFARKRNELNEPFCYIRLPEPREVWRQAMEGISRKSCRSNRSLRWSQLPRRSYLGLR